ncbi:hypothetical protein ACNI3K_06925 [Demequina sp. SO4-13]|uniref:hypothetical protein n=1 Tax=Demequina sp. SO4-13 TaxID=3401027 RepID=UPI003AF8B976
MSEAQGFDPVDDDGVQARPEARHDSPQRASRGRRILKGISWTFAAAVVAALAALSGYLWITHDQWVDQNDELRAEALTLGEELATARADAEANAAALAETQAQLAEATSTITELADGDANASDGLRVATRIIEQTQTCANERAELIGYLKNSSQYTAESLRQAESDIDTFCAEVEESWDAYLDENE